jgi:hypothetical protein
MMSATYTISLFNFGGSIEAIEGGENSVTGAGGGDGTMDTTGATLFVATVRSTTNPPVITDSAGNTWIYGPVATGSGSYVCQAWVINPLASTSHTFTPTGSDGSCDVFWFNGAGTWSVDTSAQSSSPSTGPVVVAGPITPAGTGELIIAGISSNGGETTSTIDGGFSGGISGVPVNTAMNQLLSGSPEVGSGGYLIDGTDAPISATFTGTGDNSDFTWSITAFILTP